MMIESLLRPLSICAFVLCTAGVSAQELRHAAASADRVVVATAVGVRQLGKEFVVHRLRVHRTLKGASAEILQVVERKQIVLHQSPVPAEPRIYCLFDVAAEGDLEPLASDIPLTRMTGHQGGNPKVDLDNPNDLTVALVDLVLRSEKGADAKEIAPSVLELVLRGSGETRLEAVRMLTDRSVLRDALSRVAWSELVARAVGESADIGFKIALAELCAEQRIDRLVDSLCVSFEAVQDARWCAAVGRIARGLHREAATDVLRPFLVQPRNQKVRAALLLTLGHTETESGLQALLRLRELSDGKDAAVDAALRAHGSDKALEAVGDRRSGTPREGGR